MDLNIEQHLPADFDPSSRVWIYQSSRLFTMSEAFELEEMFENFILSWNSHGTPVKGFANLFFGRFIVLMADERSTGVSGCSTDSSVRLIKEIGAKFNIELFDRLALAFIIKEKIELIPYSQMQYALDNGFIDADSLYFNNVAANKQELVDYWIIPLKNSWLARHLPSSRPA